MGGYGEPDCAGQSRDETIEEALRLSEAPYRAVVEDQAERVCRFDADHRVTFVKTVLSRFTGQTEENLLGRPRDRVSPLKHPGSAVHPGVPLT